MTGKIRAYIKMFRVMGGMCAYLSIIFIRQAIKGPDLEHAFRIRKKWAEYSIKVLGVKLEIIGDAPSEVGIIISNHRSMVDPIIQLTKFYALPVGKAEISKYPIVGKAATTTGIIFLERDSQDSRAQTRAIIKEKVSMGFNVLIYPEGTVGNQAKTKVFRKGSFEIASSEGIPILPIAIEYGHIDNRWDTSDTLIQHFIKSFSKDQIKVKLYIGEPIIKDNSWTLMKETQNWINEKLETAQQSWIIN